ncbi:MAG: class I SAM-dependent methyltransferase [Saprospiraceae bacterium]|nr:MAG: class I SAM-dependent methyltransferase [Saprospiraceae bacterium]
MKTEPEWGFGLWAKKNPPLPALASIFPGTLGAIVVNNIPSANQENPTPHKRKIMSLKNIAESLISYIPRVGQWRAAFLKHSTPGHYYSPIPDLEEVKKREAEIYDLNRNIHGIAFNDEVQLGLLEKVRSCLPEAPWTFEKKEELLYHYDNIYYTWSDALSLFGLMKSLRPKRIVEAGSGWSSAVMLDTNRLFFDSKIELTFIEPFPDRLLEVTGGGYSINLNQSTIQRAGLDVFKNLEAGDFLFIDTSHVSKTGSDVNYILFEVLPVLKPGVYIHFHDIFYPFEYPKEWIYKGYAWNENYILRAFLMDNPGYEIAFMNTYLEYKYPEKLPEKLFTRYNNSITGSIWLRKKG